ncbi:hypothetical protein CC78DRAFT_82022 [Lojkania enalia]|uniref:Uncharacterized protein n=1 Tax=Lojkania enalia TaxID=147567 RepID=A0A9P4K0Q7_9PLEO|nr:hypothetical protein CC78DRAFT_82022 [Didymosphaeria enalia]
MCSMEETSREWHKVGRVPSVLVLSLRDESWRRFGDKTKRSYPSTPPARVLGASATQSIGGYSISMMALYTLLLFKSRTIRQCRSRCGVIIDGSRLPRADTPVLIFDSTRQAHPTSPSMTTAPAESKQAVPKLAVRPYHTLTSRRASP